MQFRCSYIQTFQLTTSRRGRLYGCGSVSESRHFNSLPHAEVDDCVKSIHQSRGHFNSLPHAEVDVASCQLHFWIMSFQLTTSRRGRHNSGLHFCVYFLFQLTTSRRGRPSAKLRITIWQIFQLTTSRRGRPAWIRNSSRTCYFNSLPHAEVDNDGDSLQDVFEAFQLTTSRRGRPLRHFLAMTGRINFNSLPHAEVDRPCRCILCNLLNISTHYLTQR